MGFRIALSFLISALNLFFKDEPGFKSVVTGTLRALCRVVGPSNVRALPWFYSCSSFVFKCMNSIRRGECKAFGTSWIETQVGLDVVNVDDSLIRFWPNNVVTFLWEKRLPLQPSFRKNCVVTIAF